MIIKRVHYLKAIYPQDLIRQAARDYEKICSIRVKIAGEETIVYFANGKMDLEQIASEFSNYLIELINTQGRQYDNT